VAVLKFQFCKLAFAPRQHAKGSSPQSVMPPPIPQENRVIARSRELRTHGSVRRSDEPWTAWPHAAALLEKL